MDRRTDDVLEFEAFFDLATGGTGVTGLSPTVDVYNPAGTKVVADGAASETGGGLYGYNYTMSPASAGKWRAVFKTADATVSRKHTASMLFVGRGVASDYTAARATKLDNLDATVSSRSSHSAADVVTALEALLATGVTTVGGFFSLLKANSHSAADVWAVGTRTLTSFGTLVADIWAYVTRTLTAGGAAADPLTNQVPGDYEVGTAGYAIGQTNAKVMRPGAVRVASPGPDDAGIVTIIPGDAYGVAHGNPIPFPVGTAPDLDGATLTFQVFTSAGVALTATPTLSGDGDAREASVELTAVQTASLQTILNPGVPRPAARVYCVIVASWDDDSPLEPQTIAVGEVRRPEWDLL